jgi:hypothetical protein
MKVKVGLTVAYIYLIMIISFAWAKEESKLLSVAGFGQMKITAHISEPNSTSPPFLTFEDAAGKLLRRINFALEGFGSHPSILKFKVIQPTKESNPFIVSVASSPGGSDIHFETTIIGFVNGQISEVIPKHIESSSQDALCFDHPGDKKNLHLVFFNFIWESIHYEPHRYEVTSNEWTGSKFNRENMKQTVKKHKDWKGAAAELGYSCREDLISTINSNYK